MGGNLSEILSSQGNIEFGLPSDAENRLADFSTAGFGDPIIQGFLPGPLRSGSTDPIIAAGIEGIGDLVRNPGGLSPNVSEAILPRLSVTSEGIARNFRGIRGQQEGRLSRSNAPVSIRNALASALDVAESRSQRGARREALTDSESLRRLDLQAIFPILDAITQLISSGRGQAIGGLSSAAQTAEQRAEGARQHRREIMDSIMGSVATSASHLKEDFEGIASDEILEGIKGLPVYQWSYKGEGTRHVGPMAEDFLATFGLGDSPDHIHIIDAMGTLMAATQSLARKVERLESPN